MRAVSAITSASNGGPDGGISSDETRGAIQPINSTGMATTFRTEVPLASAPNGRCQAGCWIALSSRRLVAAVSIVLQSTASNLHGRGPVDLVDRFRQGRVKLGVAR